MSIFSTIWTNLKDKTTTGTAIMTIVAYILNSQAKVIPPDVANGILIIVNAIVLALFSKKGPAA